MPIGRHKIIITCDAQKGTAIVETRDAKYRLRGAAFRLERPTRLKLRADGPEPMEYEPTGEVTITITGSEKTARPRAKAKPARRRKK